MRGEGAKWHPDIRPFLLSCLWCADGRSRFASQWRLPSAEHTTRSSSGAKEAAWSWRHWLVNDARPAVSDSTSLRWIRAPTEDQACLRACSNKGFLQRTPSLCRGACLLNIFANHIPIQAHAAACCSPQ